MLRNNGRLVLYSAGYRDALRVATADLDALSNRFMHDYTVLLQELEALRAEVAELRTLAGLRDPSQPLQ
jgi:prephenate dehydrogenase